MKRSIACAGLLAAAPAAAQGGGLFAEGCALPDLELPLIDGSGTVRLAELTGQPTLLIQFASW